MSGAAAGAPWQSAHPHIRIRPYFRGGDVPDAGETGRGAVRDDGCEDRLDGARTGLSQRDASDRALAPHTVREALTRALIVAAVTGAALAPFLITRDADDVLDVAGSDFRALLVELDEVEARLDLLEEDPVADPAELQTLRARRAALEEQTLLGHIERPGDSGAEGSLAPDFRLLDLSGSPVRLSEVNGPAVVNFWASWCPFCIEEMPDFQRVHERFGDRVTIIGINRAEPLAIAAEFAERTGGALPPGPGPGR